MRGRNKPWAKDYIAANENLIYQKDNIITKPLTLEIGIGKGDFICQNAIANLDYQHIGIEVNTSIFAVAMKKIVNNKIENISLLNIDASKIEEFINPESIEKLYLNFSDPWPQNGYRKRRLVHPIFLEKFEKLLINNGQILFKTDNLQLFEMGVKNFKERNYHFEFLSYDYQTVPGDFVSEYEAKFRLQGMKIYRAVITVDKSDIKPWIEANK